MASSVVVDFPKNFANAPVSYTHLDVYKRQAVLRKLRRGQFQVGAVLDLHGMTVVTAKEALVAFRHHVRRNRLSCVRIIHGKGKGCLLYTSRCV